ncbi:probable inactive dual specificity protein phosphatase-like At4g18593 [Beta vulgaris subsp. vulgaris]|uniref:probable inactive dual specificity protein phosphatase-like At4g18593 n=1 Tax=Beta vulgaris subsp. vulgaris TaxID=3555 RepID=UPI0020370938|nr:probable inactive dual specificity protein phosphatase-like At4g18593 [Beta vulgaris subsp. vulgaris]XP_010696633.2 probable inactive dual specificity protein phosphatase-like At4g18593 [Beta vulgaris subsp. vulgaris]XP_010696634.2 probable inactive dual specificity protein phosphatase-like At4g18593 [Beta vulgaris subsp. vulgaris]XP_057247285.1 probable inactive dual specificity protein phosphatase-like At4g18593 [Beta vulgaris subsp. vulgaris]
MTEASCSEIKPHEEIQLIYRCKKCRQIVASQQNIVPHDQGKGEASFGCRKRTVESDSLPKCTAIFVEPLKWMQTVQEGYVFEKLYCMGCKYRLGSFNWAGMQCSCGAWINPAFQILKSRIDECQI